MPARLFPLRRKNSGCGFLSGLRRQWRGIRKSVQGIAEKRELKKGVCYRRRVAHHKLRLSKELVVGRRRAG